MKATTTTAVPSARGPFYSKKRASPASLTKRSDARRTPTDPNVELERQSAVQLALASREMQALLEMDYQDDVRAYMSKMEAKTTASVDLIDQQPELQWYMRPYLVDFLIEIHQQHRLRPETLYLALNIVDRYVSKRIVFKKHYQLVGCAALWIAAKFEDEKSRNMTVGELCQMCCGAYDESAFIQMEGHLLQTIGWVVGHPTTEAWLRLACVTGQVEEKRTQDVARFIMEITLFHKEYIPFKPSAIAGAALLLSRFLLGKSRRVPDDPEQVRIASMLDLHLAEHLDKVSVIVVKKYSFAFYSRASTFVREWYLSGRRFSYQDWVQPSTPARHARTKIINAPSSCPLVSSPTSSGSDTSSSSEDSCDDDEPLTPMTPLPPYPTPTDPYDELKENLPRPPKSLTRDVTLSAVRPPLIRASWELNTNSLPIVPTYNRP